MTVVELVDKVAFRLGCSKTQARANIDAVFDTIQAAIKEGDKVSIPDFGTFKQSKHAARKGRNPQTGEEISIPESTHAKFKEAANFWR